MAFLSNQFVEEDRVIIGQSFGPFLSLGNSQFVFDTTDREHPLWLGYYPSALCGALQFEETWTGRESEELQRVRAAHQSLQKRAKHRLPASLKLLQLRQSSTSSSPATFIYDYISLSVIDQYETTYRAIVASIKTEIEAIGSRNKSVIRSFRLDSTNFGFAFEFFDRTVFDQFCTALPRSGIHNARSAEDEANTRLRFRLNLAFRGEVLELFWTRLKLVFNLMVRPIQKTTQIQLPFAADNTSLINFHRSFICAKTQVETADKIDPIKHLRMVLGLNNDDLTIHQVTKSNYANYRQRILAMQKVVYEPARQTSAEEFDRLFDSANPLAIVVCHLNSIIAMVFAGRLELFRNQHGVDSDPFVDDPSVYYSMDLTVAPEFRGGVGRLMKQAMVMLAIENGVTAIHGRNRDRLAAGMWSINLSLGSYELQYLRDDYDDDEPYRDCIYYRCPLNWRGRWEPEKLRELSFQQVLTNMI